jgi:2,3-diketo-5-methylthiopentyl-1-phosphate enolase
MPAAGMYPGLVPVLMEEFGIDQIIPAGGGMLGHKMGYTAGAKAWRQAIDATLAGISLVEAAQDKPELRKAIEQWGVRQRPQTAWGYLGKDFHPVFADRHLDDAQ